MKKLAFLALFIGLLGVSSLCGCSGIPEPRGYVNDFANMIPDASEASLEATLAQFEAKTTNEVVVVTVKTTGGKSIEDYTITLAEKWGVGKKEKDNGAVILVAEKEREVRIEVGYGLESTLTDAQAKIIIEKEILPRFRNGDYDGGIQAGVNAVIGTIEGTFNPEQTADTGGVIPSGGLPVWAILLLILAPFSIVIIILAVVVGKRAGSNTAWYSGNYPYRNTGGFRGGFGGGGFSGGFGGGGFGGGGASGHW